MALQPVLTTAVPKANGTNAPTVANHGIVPLPTYPGGGGYIRSAKVEIQGSPTAPPGRYWAVLRVTEPAAGVGTVLGAIWLGYVIANRAAVSLPNLFYPNGCNLVLQLYGGQNADNTQVVEGRVYVSDTPEPGGGSIFAEAPYTGPGEKIEVLANNSPAAGADMAQIAVGAYVRWRLLSLYGKLVAAAGGSNRYAVLEVVDGAGNVESGQATSGIGAGQTALVSWTRGGSNSDVASLALANGQTLSNQIGDAPLTPGETFGIVTTNIAAGDQWSKLTAAVEEWAGPTND